jgi:hypothetical protein
MTKQDRIVFGFVSFRGRVFGSKVIYQKVELLNCDFASAVMAEA